MSKYYVLNNLKSSDLQAISDSLLSKKLAVLPTDTIYGLHGLALSDEVQDLIYSLKQRNRSKGFIFLISDLADLQQFNIKLKRSDIQFLRKIWPGRVSVVLHRESDSLAFRMPNMSFLQSILKVTGPLISTSANLSGKTSAQTITQAEEYLGDQVALYVNAGKLAATASTVIDLEDNNLTLIREGAVSFQSLKSDFEALHKH